MKKNKKSIKKLKLNKNVISNLEENQVNGGIVTINPTISKFIACPPIFTEDCVSKIFCPVETLDPGCILVTRVACTQVGCPTDFVC